MHYSGNQVKDFYTTSAYHCKHGFTMAGNILENNFEESVCFTCKSYCDSGRTVVDI